MREEETRQCAGQHAHPGTRSVPSSRVPGSRSDIDVQACLGNSRLIMALPGVFPCARELTGQLQVGINGSSPALCIAGTEQATRNREQGKRRDKTGERASEHSPVT